MNRAGDSLNSVVLCGHNKCGTRWLAGVIAASSSLKLVSPNQRGLTERDLTSESICRLKKLVAVSSVPVFFDFPHAIQNDETLAALKQIDPDMGGILVYREPTDAMLSMHNYQRWSYSSGKLYGTPSNLTVDRTIRDEELVDAIIQGPLRAQYEDLYRYDRNAQKLRSCFPQRLELLYEDLTEDPTEFVARIFQFCGVPLDVEPSRERVNTGMAVKSLLLDRLLTKSFLLLTGMNSKALHNAYKAGKLQASPYRFLLRLNEKPAHFLKPPEVKRLREFFMPMVSELEKITDLDLGCWGYSAKSPGK